MIAKVTMTKNMIVFFLNMEINVFKYLKTRVKYQTWLWHIRLKQVNFDSLKMMMKKERLKGLPSIKHLNQLREGCLVGKQFYKSFSKEFASRTSQPLQEIHTEVCDPIQPCLFDKNFILCSLLMIIIERHEYTSFKKSLIVFNYFKSI